ncbi:ABC transporter permease [Heyndrickxia sporothermodurans]
MVLLLLINGLAIYLSNTKKLHFIGSGIIISVLGPILAFLIGAIFVKIDHKTGGTGEGAGFAAGFIGLIIIGNGIIYFLIGLFLKISSLTKKREL